MTILEKNGIEQTYFNGATLNRLITANQDGRVYGVELTNTSSSVSVSAGLLVIRGYRIMFSSETILNVSSFPSVAIVSTLVLSLTVSDGNVTSSVFIGNATNTDEIEKSDGTYDYVMAHVSIGPNGISRIGSAIQNIEINASSGGTHDCGISKITNIAVTEPNLITLLGTLQPGIYKVNTLLHGDEIIFVSNKKARFTSDGKGYVYNSSNGMWEAAVTENPNASQGTKWHAGTVVNSSQSRYDRDDNIAVGDFYINTQSGKVFRCTSHNNTPSGGRYMMFEYLYNTKTTLDIVDDTFTTTVIHSFVNNEDATYYAQDISSITLVIPANISHGFTSSVNINIPSTLPTVTIANQSALPHKIIRFNSLAETIPLDADETACILVYCDGINVNLFVFSIPNG